MNHASLLEEVCLNFSAGDGALTVEMHIDPFAKARRVVVSEGLGVAECLEHCTISYAAHNMRSIC